MSDRNLVFQCADYVLMWIACTKASARWLHGPRICQVRGMTTAHNSNAVPSLTSFPQNEMDPQSAPGRPGTFKHAFMHTQYDFCPMFAATLLIHYPCFYAREREPWEASDGALYLLRELADVAPKVTHPHCLFPTHCLCALIAL